MKYLKFILIILPFLFNSCSCEREGDVDGIPNTPGWVASQFYAALADGAYYDAMEYCDKSSKRKLENDYNYINNLPQISFVKVDSCDEYEDHAFCYCRYKNEDSTEQTHKLLLRNFDAIWKVHYDMDTTKVAESRLYSDRLEELDHYNLSPAPITDIIKYEMDSVLSESIRIMNNSQFVIGFFSSNDIHEVCLQASKESTYDDSYVKRNYLDELETSTTFYFSGNNILNRLEVVLLDVESWKIEGVYQYMIEGLIEEYGTPYNAKDTPVEHLYRYKEIKWFLNSYNEELIISNEFQNITISLNQAH